jgi:hypothetical protein
LSEALVGKSEVAERKAIEGGTKTYYTFEAL